LHTVFALAAPAIATGLFGLVLAVKRGRRKRVADTPQVAAVRAARFHAKAVMNKGEYRLFRLVEASLADIPGARTGYRVFAQTSLGEILSSEDRRAFAAINSKRVDLLIVGPQAQPLAAIEYQGAGHYQGDAETRDWIKREALRRAGVAYVEVFERDSDAAIRRKILGALKR
jgi:hypothetical protein